MDERDDAELVRAMARGEKAAMSALYDRYAARLMGLAVLLVRDRDEAQDLVHDVFVEVWRVAGQYDPSRGRVWTWLAVRMRSRAIDLITCARRTRNAGSEPLAIVPDDREGSSPDHARVRAALSTLVTTQRDVVELAYFEGLTCTEIAARRAIPLGTVKSRLAKGLGHLRQSLDACHAA